MFIKFITLFLLMSSFYMFSMQEKPVIEDLRYGPADLWVYEADISSKTIKEIGQIDDDIMQAYRLNKELKELGHSNLSALYFKIEDSQENIIQKFKDKAWFSESNLHRPPYVVYRHLNRHPADIRNNLCCRLQ